MRLSIAMVFITVLMCVGFVSGFQVTHRLSTKPPRGFITTTVSTSPAGKPLLATLNNLRMRRIRLSLSSSVSDDHVSEATSQNSSLPVETTNVVRDFIAKIQQNVDSESFVSCTLRGPSVPKKGKHKGDKERFRGCIRQVQGRLIVLNNSKQKKQRDATFLQITIKYYGATDVAKNWRVDNDEIQNGFSLLLLPSESDERTMVLSEWGERGLHTVGSEMGMQWGELVTTNGTWEMDVSYRGSISKKPRLWKRRATAKSTSFFDVQLSAPPTAHDRTKQVPIVSDAPFLQALGLSKPDGKPRLGMSSKLRQCQKFVEIVGGLVQTSVADRGEASNISVLDMGCGRGYLTFSLHSFLAKKYGPKGSNVRSRGIDIRPKLVNEISCIARSLGPDFDGLAFEEGTIEGALASETGELDMNSLSILIALHACDTATDDALWTGIRRGSDVIVVAPCCHKEVRKQLDPHVAKTGKDHPLADILRHGIYRERAAETATDSIRALLLEISNYNVQVFEFIGGEHTSKNVMITATKRQRARAAEETEDLRKRLESLCALHGVQRQRLAHWTGENLREEENLKTRSHLSSKSMPPL